MVKFGVELRQGLVPEWRLKYMPYTKLKKLIERHQTIVQNGYNPRQMKSEKLYKSKWRVQPYKSILVPELTLTSEGALLDIENKFFVLIGNYLLDS